MAISAIGRVRSYRTRVTKLLADGGVKQVDYLSGIIGLDTQRIQARAVEVTLSNGTTIRALHPLDVLESRLRNIESLSSRQNGIGIAQANLAISVAREFIRETLANRDDTRLTLDAIERIAKMALDKGLVAVAVNYGVDPLDAVPASEVANPDFQTKRWPQILSHVAELRLRHQRRVARPRSP